MTKQEMLQAVELAASFPANPKAIVSVELAANADDCPVARMLVDGDEWDMCEWELTDAPRIAVFNALLETLNLGAEIAFENYTQYGELLQRVDALIKQRRANEKEGIEYGELHDMLLSWSAEVSEAVLLLETAFRFTEDDITHYTKAKREELDNLITVTRDKLQRLDDDITAKMNGLAKLC